MTRRSALQGLAAASDFDASDLHLVAGVPPAFRVNGEIIIADEDVLTERDVADIASEENARAVGPRCALPSRQSAGFCCNNRAQSFILMTCRRAKSQKSRRNHCS